MTFAELLVELRLARGLSQEELATRAMVSVRAISDLERGTTRRPQRETVRALADGLTLDAAERDRFAGAARQAPPSAARRAGRPQPSLPAPVSSIVGRDADLRAVVRLVRDPAVRLVTVTGPGGVGKTRFAVEVGWQVSGGFDRVGVADLSPLRRADDVADVLAAAVGCRTAGGSAADQVAAFIGTDRWLLLLDNFEHVAAAAGGMAALLAACPRLTLLATSRTPLRLRGEHLWPLAPLPVPADGHADPAALDANPAVALLSARTRAVRPGFAVTAANAAAVAHLCRGLDGLPLAIELAAAHLRTQEPAALVEQLASRATELRADVVDAPDRHRTLRRTVEWSTGLLAHGERLLLGVLGVFSGGATSDAVRAVVTAPDLAAAGLDPARVDGSVSLLAASSLLGVADRAGAARIAMLDTIREIAIDLLAAAGLDRAARTAHATYFLDLVRAARSAPDGFGGVDRDIDNVRAALAWSTAADPDRLDAALAQALTAYFSARGRFAEGGRVLRAVAGAAGDDATRARAWHGAGIAANESGDHEGAIEAAQRSAALFDGLGDPLGRCTAIAVVGNAQKALGRYDLAEAAHRTCLDLATKVGEPRAVTVALNNLGTLAQDRGDHPAAREHYAESLRLKQELGDVRGTAVALMNLGALDNELGRYADGQESLRRSVRSAREAGEPHTLAYALALLAEAELGLGRREPAEASATEALRLARQVEYAPAIGLALARLGDLALVRGDAAAATGLLTEALEYTRGAPDVARNLEHLAATYAVRAPGEARRLLDRAADIRRDNRTPVQPADVALLERVRRAVGSA